MRLAPVVALLLAFAASSLPAQGVASAPAQAVTRRDLADAYLQVDRIAAERGIPEAKRGEWNEAFDRTTLAFFGGDFAKVLRDMHDLTARMLGDSAVGSPTRQLLALRLRAEPRILTPSDSSLRLVLTVMYGADADPARRIRLRVVERDGQTVTGGDVVVPAGSAAGRRIEFVVSHRQLPPPNLRLTAIAELEGAAATLEVPVFLFERSADSLRADLDRAASAAPAGGDLQALASVRARIALLRDVPDEGNTAQFLADPLALTAALVDEMLALSMGRNPYRRTGDIWRVLQMPSGPVAFRLYVPPQARANPRLPLVIALHGAGADENMFLEGYGHGRLRTLADSLGFIVASPMTTDFVREPAALDSLLAVVARSNDFDRARVYLVGHSLGAGVSLRLAAQRRDVVRAAALIAGAGSVPAGESVAPTLFIAAERDLVIPASRVRAAYDQLRAAAAPVEFEMATGWGHTLVVGPALDRAIAFLLRH